MEMNYGIIAVKRDELKAGGKIGVHHFVYFEELPSFNDYASLYKELAEDEELGLTEVIGELVLVPASEDTLKHFKEVTNDRPV